MRICEKVVGPFVLALGVLAAGTASAIPPAPTLLSPAGGATVVQPFTESWSAVTDPSGIVGYNWQISASSAFTNIASQGSTSGAIQASISGLNPGTYFFRVQAADGAFEQGTFSASHSLIVSGSGPGAPAAPVLQPTRGYSTFHPYELEVFNWNVVPDALTYTLQFSLDSTFSVPKTAQSDNLPTPTTGFEIANPEGNYFARVFAKNAAGILSAPSNTITFSVFFNNPIGPPPATLTPLNGGTVSLPITLSWSDVPNPEPNGYELEIAKDSAFKTVEDDEPGLNDPFRVIVTLTPGTKFWRVRSVQGDSTPLLPALTAWSVTGTFAITSAPAVPVSLTLATPTLYSGDSTFIMIQASAAVPAGGTNMAVTSSNQVAFPVPAVVQMPGGFATTSIAVQAGQITAPAPVTVTVTLNSQTVSIQFTVMPPSIKNFDMPVSVIGGDPPQTYIMLNGEAPPNGAVISLSSNSPALTVPASVTVSPGFYWALVPVVTNPVSVATPVTLTATGLASTVQNLVTVLPPLPPVSISLSPASVVGGSGVSVAGVVIGTYSPGDDTLQVTVSNPAVATMVPATVTIPLGSTIGGFNISTNPVTVATPVTISVSGGGKTVSAVLTVTPAAQVAVSTLTLAPTSVTGGAGSVGTVTLVSAAPFSGALVTLSSSSSAASVPANVTVASGATSATFAIATSAVAVSTAATITATGGGIARTAALTVNSPSQTATVTVTATGRNGTNVVSSPTGINVASGSTGHASFTIGTAVTLSVTGGRSAIWSGACTGNKTTTCAFTVTGNATVNAAVQ
jgi:hypothetical protein